MEVNNQISTTAAQTSQRLKSTNIKSIKSGDVEDIGALNKIALNKKSRSEFMDKFDKIKSESVREELEKIFEKISVQSDKIGEKVYLKDILEYKKLVKEFLNVATQNSNQFNNESYFDRKGRYRNYSVVKTVDRELDSLTRDFINGQIDHIGILQRMDDIRGMLLDIMM